MKFQHLKKYYIDLMKYPKYEHQSTLHYGGGSNLILGTGRGKIFFSNNSSHNQFFSSNSQKMTLWCKKRSLPTQMHLYNPYVVPYTLP